MAVSSKTLLIDPINSRQRLIQLHQIEKLIISLLRPTQKRVEQKAFLLSNWGATTPYALEELN